MKGRVFEKISLGRPSGRWYWTIRLTHGPFSSKEEARDALGAFNVSNYRHGTNKPARKKKR